MSRRVGRRAPWLSLALAAAVALAGCGSGDEVYQLSGAVTFDGQPIPKGSIIFEPDASLGAQASAGFAKIANGRYDTSSEDGRGVVGGPHQVRILGLDGVPRGELVNGMPLFPEYNTTADLPKADGTLDFTVPRSAR